MNYDVFVSYARQRNRTEVIGLAEALRKQGINVFIDQEDIETGDVFPERLAEALVGSRVVVVLADALYFERPWCVHEFQVALAPYRAALMHGKSTQGQLDNIVVILDPIVGDGVLSHLPPPLARQDWPIINDTGRITSLVKERLQTVTQPLGGHLADLQNDPAVSVLRGGADVPPPGDLSGRLLVLGRMPGSLGAGFVGRTESLWQLFHYLESCRVAGHPSSCAVTGTAGVGKTQLIAEYVWRYAPHYYPGGVVWIDAEQSDRVLEDQFREVLRVFAGGGSVSSPTDMNDLPAAICRHVASAARNGRMLWIVDNLPPPAAGSSAMPLEHWCPPRNVVDLLCTSRRSWVMEVDVRLMLRELTPDAATEWLTRPPVSRSRLTDDEWHEVVRWVGCLPLALRILHTSLAGFVDPKDFLARSRGQEPAAALDDEVDSLREEFSAAYLRGIADALHDAYQNLEHLPGLLRSAHLLSWFAPVPTSADAIAGLVPRRQAAQLANRGWIETTVSASGGDLEWRMHRVVASYLLTRGGSGTEDLSRLAHWLVRAFDPSSEWSMLKNLVPHAFYILWGIDGLRLGDGSLLQPEHVEAALHMATFRLSERAADALRYESAGLISDWGYGRMLLDRLAQGFALHNAASLTGIAGILPAIDTPAAAEICVNLLLDERKAVRESALTVADSLARHTVIAIPLLDAVLASTDRSAMFTKLGDKPSRYHYFVGNQTGSRYRVESTTSDGRPQPVVWDPSFWAVVQNDVARESLIRLASSQHGDRVAEQLAGALRTWHTLEDGLQAIDRLGLFLRAMETSEPYRFEEVVKIDPATNEVLGYGYRQRVPAAKEFRPDRYAALIELILRSEDSRLAQRAVEACLWTAAGSRAMSDKVHGMLDQGEYQQALFIAEAAVRADDDYENGHWWCGLALANLNKAKEACASFGRVIRLNPGFSPARIERADMFISLGDPEAALRELDLAGKHAVKDLGVALDRADRYLLLNAFEKAEAAASTAIKMDATCSEAWFMRAVARLRLSNADGARRDGCRAAALDPRNQEIEDFLKSLPPTM